MLVICMKHSTSHILNLQFVLPRLQGAAYHTFAQQWDTNNLVGQPFLNGCSACACLTQVFRSLLDSRRRRRRILQVDSKTCHANFYGSISNRVFSSSTVNEQSMSVVPPRCLCVFCEHYRSTGCARSKSHKLRRYKETRIFGELCAKITFFCGCTNCCAHDEHQPSSSYFLQLLASSACLTTDYAK